MSQKEPFFDIDQKKTLRLSANLWVSKWVIHFNLFVMIGSIKRPWNFFVLVSLLLSCEKTDLPITVDKSTDSISGSAEFSVFTAKTWFEHEYLAVQKKSETEISRKLVRAVFWKQALKNHVAIVPPIPLHWYLNQERALVGEIISQNRCRMIFLTKKLFWAWLAAFWFNYL